MKVSIIGFGRMGQKHLLACQNLGLNVISICDPKYTQQEILTLSPNASLFTDLDSLLSGGIPDVAIIATTADGHFEIATKLIARGVKYILCEKPVVTDLRDGLNLLSLVTESNVHFSVNHQMRYMESYRIVKEIAQEYSLGDIRAMNVSGSNIGLAMNGTHYFEAFSWLTGTQISRVIACLDSEILANPRGIQFKDNSGQILCRNSKNQRLYLDIGGDLGHELIVDYAFRTGHITINEIQGYGSVTVRNSDSSSLPTNRYGLPGVVHDFNFVEAGTEATSASTLSDLISNGDYPSLIDGIHTISVAFAAILSNQSGSKAINISEISGQVNSQPWA